MLDNVDDSMLGLVELSDVEGLLDILGQESFKGLRKEYLARMQGWIRADDKWRILENNRFCVILKGVNGPAELELAAAKLARLFEEPYYHLATPVNLEVRAGFVSLKGPNADVNGAIRKAGKALRHARRSLALFELYGPHCEESALNEQTLVSQLEAAVELGEFELYYQPKIHAGYGNLVGAEALMRWHTKDRKVIMPEQFIGVAERHKVIKPMTWWAIKSAVSRLARWPTDLSISVNVPPNLLLDDEIFTVVQDSLDIHGVEHSRLTLEVTESIMVDNQAGMLSQLARLRSIGVRISIDDFGTGFSSLLYFRDLPADEIKIDMGFVIPMLSSKKDHAIVKAVIDLAHNFSLRVVAEGVENEKVAKRLAELGCDVLQGYVFDRALILEDFEKRYIV